MSRTHKDEPRIRKEFSYYRGIASWFKRMNSRKRRRMDAHAMRNGKEPEKWRRTDSWDWF